MPLDLTSLKKAIAALKKSTQVAIDVEKTNPADESLCQTLQSGVIQNFEVVYELCWKMIKRWLEHNAQQQVDGVTRRELFRLAAESRLIASVDAWMDFHKARNETSHTYDGQIAEEVFQFAQNFVPVASALLQTLESRNA